MGIDRRSFLKIVGLSALGVSSGAWEVLQPGEVDAAHGHAAAEHVEKAATRWAMVVDMRRCKDEKGCTKCIDACRLVHNIPVIDNPKREVKWIWKEEYEHAFPDSHNEYMPDELKETPFILMCNHCDHPPCVRVCPTKATFKRPDGIVAMDYHRCIGCRFCMAACPYGSRNLNWINPRLYIKEINNEFPTRMKGVVEKCNFCVERLAKGLQPACVEACHCGALLFGNLHDPESNVRRVLRSNVSIRRKPELGTHPCVFYLV